jgi:hypothetical protein
MKRLILTTFTLTIIFVLSQSAVCSASITLPWSTTFDCSEWVSGTNSINCNGLEGGLTCAEGPCNCESITSAANHAAGAGGKGQRHPICTGSGSSGGGSVVYFATPQRELWIRWYMRYDSNFSWNQYRGKIFYLYTNGNVELIPEWEENTGSSFSFTAQGASYNNEIISRGFDDIMGSGSGDNVWHYYEIHIKADSNGANGIGEIWVDNLPVQSLTNINYGMSNGSVGWTRMTIGSNYNSVSAKGNCDYDDIAISNTGRIGQISTSPSVTPPSYTTLFSESFSDGNIAARGWYDDTSVDIDTSTKYGASGGSLRLAWGAGGSAPPLLGAIRKGFTATDNLYISQYWRFNSDWVGSGISTHPHIVYILSDQDGEWDGLANNYLDTYIETNNLTPRLITQDGLNINYGYGALPNNIASTNESRDVSGCNGAISGQDAGSATCYDNGGGSYRNGRTWNGLSNFSLNTWHHVETHFRMNSISGGKAVADGIMRMWVDGELVINNTHMVFRTNGNPTKKWKTFIIAPYMGSSPQAQTMWIDEVVVGNALGIDSISSPHGLKVITP